MTYAIEFLPDAVEHLDDLSARERAVLFDTVCEQLTHQPTVETRNRKAMRPNLLATWELRIGAIRVFYDVQEVPTPTVQIVAIGKKEGDKVRIGNKVVEL